MSNLYKVEPSIEFTRYGSAPVLIPEDFSTSAKEVQSQVIALNFPVLAANEEEAKLAVLHTQRSHWLSGATQEKAEANIASGIPMIHSQGYGIKVTLIKENATDADYQHAIPMAERP